MTEIIDALEEKTNSDSELGDALEEIKIHIQCTKDRENYEKYECHTEDENHEKYPHFPSQVHLAALPFTQ